MQFRGFSTETAVSREWSCTPCQGGFTAALGELFWHPRTCSLIAAQYLNRGTAWISGPESSNIPFLHSPRGPCGAFNCEQANISLVAWAIQEMKWDRSCRCRWVNSCCQVPLYITISEQASEMSLNNFQCHIKTGKQQEWFVLILVKKIDAVFGFEDLKLREKKPLFWFSSHLKSWYRYADSSSFKNLVASSKQLTL